jgi:hypothetical protein
MIGPHVPEEERIMKPQKQNTQAGSKTFGALLLTALFATVLAPSASGSTIAVQSYSMYNGGTGTYNYQDTIYSNCVAGDCDITGAPLSGGTGKLTDGVFSTVDWSAGPPEAWVGWETTETNGLNPLVTFFFSGTPTINSVSVWFDNTLDFGLVGAPASISVNGTNYTGIPQNTYGAQGFTISGLDITGSSVNVQFFQSDPWIMIGQVTFAGTTSTVPEPAASTLITTGLLGLVGLASLRRWRASSR